VHSDPRQHWPTDAVHEPDFDMKPRVLAQVRRHPHRSCMFRSLPQGPGLKGQAFNLFVPESCHRKRTQ
jgi:hypothetical protein